MTLTARATEFVVKHRILAYVLATLALSIYLIVSFSPASIAADDNGVVAQPGSFYSSAYENCRYLTFCRWDNLAQTGQPPVVGMPVVFITNLFFALGQFAFFCIGQLFIIMDSFNLYYRMIFFGDSLFSSIGEIVRNPLQPLFGVIIVAAIAVIAFSALFPQVAAALNRKRSSKSHGSNIMNTALWSTIGMILFFLMTVASSNNHTGAAQPSKIGLVANEQNDTSALAKENTITQLAKTPSNWSFMSLGWAISWGNVGVNLLGDMVSNVIATVGDTITFSNPAAPGSDCTNYVNGMHTLYKGPNPAIDSKKGVIALENLYQKTMLTQYVQSTFGSSVGANNAWCRVLELNQPVGDQVLIARTAKVYVPMTDLVMSKDTRDKETKEWTWKPASEAIPQEKAKLNGTSGASIRDSKLFVDEYFGAGWATSLFSPPNVYKDFDNARAAHRSYFAACLSSGSEMKLNPEWAGVVPAAAGEELKDWVLNDSWCQAVASGVSPNDHTGVEDKKGTTNGKNEAVGFWKLARGVDGANPDYEGTKWIHAFSFNNGQSENIFSVLFSGGEKDLSPNFVGAPGGLGGQAYLYYTTSSGIQYGAALLSSFIMLITVFLVARLIVPLIAGGALAQLLGGFSLIGLAVTLICLMIWPSDHVKQMNMKLVGVAIGGSLVSTIFAAAFNIFAVLFGFTTSIFYTAPTAENFRVISNLNAVGLVLASIVSYFTMKMLLKKALNFDATNLKTAMASSGKAVMAPMKGRHDSFRDAAASPLRSASDMMKMPDGDKAADTGWGKLRNAGATAASNTADLLTKGKTKSDVSTKSPQGATSTNGNAGKKDGTMSEPLIPTAIFDPKGGTHGAAYGSGNASAGSAQGDGTKLPNQLGFGKSSTLSDEQQRKRLMDQIKANYGIMEKEKGISNGFPPDWETKLGNAPLSEVKRLADSLNFVPTGADRDRAAPNEAADNLLRMRKMGDAAMKENPMGFDPSVGYAERAATQANMFRNVRPVSDHDLSQLSPAERASYDKRHFDTVGGALPERHVVSFDQSSAGVNGGDVSRDALTGRSVPNAVVRSGSQNLGTLEGVTGDGSVLYGTQRNAEGTSDWNVSTLNSGSRQLPPSMLTGGQVPPAGVNQNQWNDVQDMHSWINEKGMTADNTAISAWPQDRQEQASRVAEVMGNVMKSQGVATVNSNSLGELATTGVGITETSKEVTAFGSTSDSDFDPSVLRNILTTGNAKIADMRKGALERQSNLLSDHVDEKVALVQSKLASDENVLKARLSESISLEHMRAESQFGGLLEALDEKNSALAREISELMADDKWDEIVDVLGDAEESEADEELYDRLRDIASESRQRLSDLNRTHRDQLEELYENAAISREEIAESMHRDIEAQLADDIEREIDDAEHQAFSEAPETVRAHVEGMRGWFPNINFGKRKGMLGKVDKFVADQIS